MFPHSTSIALSIWLHFVLIERLFLLCVGILRTCLWTGVHLPTQMEISWLFHNKDVSLPDPLLKSENFVPAKTSINFLKWICHSACSCLHMMSSQIRVFCDYGEMMYVQRIIRVLLWFVGHNRTLDQDRDGAIASESRRAGGPPAWYSIYDWASRWTIPRLCCRGFWWSFPVARPWAHWYASPL